MNVCGVAYPTRLNRFEVVYSLTPYLDEYHAIRVTTHANKVTPVPSVVTPLFDRTYSLKDILGVYFEGHPELRHILTEYGIEGNVQPSIHA
ncbi:hypothetical protein CcCBS67573_g00632 [Chytriomyces confervae]|uniref:NADH:ubiquinone oxidoreductase 30kDa subunit domain-containing protein n=1 Tax=Chytriomyces confervae TaxID=246404 RepID=A0A507FNX9_9FUNG|nr:hypothetical protein CcCBS67573_g00632 [Chytriomyces confervae]